MALALFWAVLTGMWDAVHCATPDEKSPGTSTPQPAARPDLAFPAWHPVPSGPLAATRPTAAVVERVAELMGGKPDPPDRFSVPSPASLRSGPSRNVGCAIPSHQAMKSLAVGCPCNWPSWIGKRALPSKPGTIGSLP
jgi:hypothetical protein